MRARATFVAGLVALLLACTALAVQAGAAALGTVSGMPNGVAPAPESQLDAALRAHGSPEALLARVRFSAARALDKLEWPLRYVPRTSALATSAQADRALGFCELRRPQRLPRSDTSADGDPPVDSNSAPALRGGALFRSAA